MTTEIESTITRAQLQEICERTIQAIPSLTHEDQVALRHVARTARTVVGDSTWWDTKTECGCLVGTLLKGDPITILRDDLLRAPTLHRAGSLYLRELFRVTNHSWPWLDYATWPWPHRIPVIDP